MRDLTVNFKKQIITSCYIFVDLGESPLLAGRYMIDANGRGHFTYGKTYVENPKAFPLDPINLPFTQPLKIFHPLNGKGVFRVLSDSTPDNWGRRVMSAVLFNPPKNEVEWLLATCGNGAGCIVANDTHHPPKFREKLNSYTEIENFFVAVDEFVSGYIPTGELNLGFGSTMGGLRPKLTIAHEGKEWIAKIKRKDDKFNMPAVEYATMKMAQKAGIIIPNIQLHEVNRRSVLLIERFDRNVPSRKLHYISAHSLINAHRINERDTAKNYSYMGIADIAKRITANPIEEQKQLYRRMVFNTLIGNTGDHMKNHGFLMTDYTKKLYSLSPAFDMLPHLDAEPRQQSIGIGEFRREASIKNLLSSVGRFGLRQNQATIILEEVQDIVKDWKIHYQEAGAVMRDRCIVENCFL